MFECLYCGEFFKRRRDDCPFCGSEGVIWVDEEDVY
jgi:rRNA maturation endonuclease Nob1